MMHCQACAVDVAPMVTLGDNGGMVRMCPRCNGVLEAIQADTPRNRAPEPVAQKPAPVAQPARKAATPASFDVIKEAKKRRKYISSEVRRLRKELKAAEKEEAQLKRLLAAADQKPEARVRLLRAK